MRQSSLLQQERSVRCTSIVSVFHKHFSILRKKFDCLISHNLQYLLNSKSHRSAGIALTWAKISNYISSCKSACGNQPLTSCGYKNNGHRSRPTCLNQRKKNLFRIKIMDIVHGSAVILELHHISTALVRSNCVTYFRQAGFQQSLHNAKRFGSGRKSGIY